MVADVAVSMWVILGLGAGFESEDATSALWFNPLGIQPKAGRAG